MLMFGWSKDRRRKQFQSHAMPAEWLATIRSNLWQYRYLLPPEKEKLHNAIKIMVAEKNWEGCGGFQVDDVVKVTVAAQAAFMLLGVPEGYYFDGVKSILIYPSAYLQPPGSREGFMVPEHGLAVSGESWHRGPIVLSWDSVLAGGKSPNRGQNLVFHEFAHHIDGLDGDMDGSPPFTSKDQYRDWYRVAKPEYRSLVEKTHHGEPTLLDEYGATNEVEFFAVATEVFFQRPEELRLQHTQLYAIFRTLYEQDPASRLHRDAMAG